MAPPASHASNGAGGVTNSDQSAALRGASLAFQKKRQPPTSEPQPQLQQRASNGALTAATVSAQSTGSSGTAGLPDMDQWLARGVVSTRLQQLGTPQQQQQQLLQPTRGVDPKSPSFIAATLAASRSASPTPKARTPRRRVSIGTASTTSDAVDSEHIPPTNSLISMFERGKGEPVAALLSHETVERSSRSVETARLMEQAFPNERAARRNSRSSASPDRTVSAKPSASKRDILPATPSKPPTRQAAKQSSTPDLRQLAPLPQQPAVPKKPDHPPVQEIKPTKPSDPPPQKKTVPKITNRYNSPPEAEAPRPRSPPPQKVVTRQPEVLSPKPKRLSRPNLEPPSSPIRTPGKGLPTTEMSPGDPQKKTTPISKPVAQRPPTPPKPIARQPTQPPPPRNAESGRPRSEGKTEVQKPQPPVPPKPRGTKKIPVDARPSSPDSMTALTRKKTSDTISSNDAFFSAPTSPEQEFVEPPPRRKLSVSSPSPATEHRRRLSVTPSRGRSGTPSNTNMSLGSLTSAIMAGSLAARRLTPTNTGSSLPPTPRRQKSPHLRQTLRRPVAVSDDEDAEKHKRSHHIKLHSGRHAHHEGARKRWRDEVRPRERKRYEAIWASNRGLLLPSAPPSPPSFPKGGVPPPVIDHRDCVANVVVREIWRRSRLAEDELAEVWDLVDRNGTGMLNRQEFIVGMWLIDQCLKGRKIPQKVTASVWGSTGNAGSANVKVRGPR